MPTTSQDVTLGRLQNRRQASPPTTELRIAATLEQIADTLEALNKNAIELLEHVQREERRL